MDSAQRNALWHLAEMGEVYADYSSRRVCNAAQAIEVLDECVEDGLAHAGRLTSRTAYWITRAGLRALKVPVH